MNIVRATYFLERMLEFDIRVCFYLYRHIEEKEAQTFFCHDKQIEC